MGGRPLGQHFLQDPRIIDQILAAANPQPGQKILEIGPGRGALTYPMLLSGARVLAVEVDEQLAARLKPADHLRVVRQDILQTRLSELLADGPYKVVANLPYYITTPILEKVLQEGHGLIDELVLMMQHEVAERIVKPANRLSGSLTHFVRFHAQAEYLFKVPPSAFLPPPEVDSAVLRFRLHAPPEDCLARRFFDILRRSFAQRRKMLRSSLKGLINDEQFQKAGVEPQRRPETLHFEEFLALERCSRS
ncbi:MAG: ribosomal RNA small subunit methyltransferase A [Candidatus Eremiobacteraeota bacterium]|nr:ribosomal RNA small subunit methyltransferase A [Candidatus Eremiobacteraeota bacterium]MCW5872031.1 ribosomal RNA small subunit methyltransferase A [Candidatus Eremiobacteraeota bacterium]